MSAPTFSLLHATYGRPSKAIAAMGMAMTHADNPQLVEYIFAVNQDDEPTLDAIRYLRENNNNCWPFKFVVGDFAGSAPAWDAAAKVAHGSLFIQMQDDLELPLHWDGALLEELEGANTDKDWWIEHPVVVAVRDGYRKDTLLCTAICNAVRYVQQRGEFIHPGYRSVFSDDEFSVRAYADEADGKCQVIRTDLVFRHENPYHTGAPHDATLARENSPEAYAKGGTLFLQRNQPLIDRGFKTW